MESIEFRLLGPIEMSRSGFPVELGHAKQRCVLAVLLMDAGRAVPVTDLIDRVWGHRPPDAALNVLYGYVARLRKALGPAGVPVVRRSGSYQIDVDPDRVDVHRFRRLLSAVPAAGPPAGALPILDEALGLWRGTPFTGLSGAWVTMIREALEDQHLSAVIARNEARLGAGAHAELVGQLLEMVAVHPADERLVAQLMVAMVRSGRRSDAVEQYRLARRRLRDLQGSDPGPLLQNLVQRILRADDGGRSPFLPELALGA
jgi:DNA-binding SARP family transcriptional activator